MNYKKKRKQWLLSQAEIAKLLLMSMRQYQRHEQGHVKGVEAVKRFERDFERLIINLENGKV